MLTIKLVVIGASGVGKTSLRGQYISGQFSTGYRATIGADFISKTLPHPHIPDESITLQIWDTAGQERFAALASAFYRGADAVLLMFDVNRPETLTALRSSWAHFCACTRLGDVGGLGDLGGLGDVGSVCVVVVGNKMDLVGTEHGAPQAVPPASAWEVIRELVPGLARPQLPAHDHTNPDSTPNPAFNINHGDNDDNPMITHTQLCEDPEDSADIDIGVDAAQSQHAPSESIAIRHHSHSHSHSPLHSHSHSHSRFDTSTTTSVRTVNTMHTMRSAATIYHTPASSLSSDTDIFHSARTSPEHSLFSSSSSSSHSYSSSSLPLRANSPNATSTRARRNTAVSTSSASSDGATITPGMLARDQRSASVLSMSTTLSTAMAPLDDTTNTHTNTRTTNTNPHPHPNTSGLGCGAQLFYTSAKTGVGVGGVFEAVVRQVVGRWAREEVWEEQEEQEAGRAGRMDGWEAGGGSISAGGSIKRGLDLRLGTQKRKLKEGAGCCG